MKKIIIAILLCVCFVLTGCSYGGAGLAQNSDGTVTEYYFVPFPEEELLSLGVSKTEIYNILLELKKDLDTNTFGPLIDAYQKRIEENADYSFEQKKTLVDGVRYESNLPIPGQILLGYHTKIQYQIYFDSALCYAEFKNANPQIKEEKVVQTKKTLFTTTSIVKKDPLFDVVYKQSVTIGKNFTNKVNETMQQFLPTKWEFIKEQLNFEENSSKFSYSYIVPSKRVHSNAKHVQRGENGYYYHTWEIDLNNVDENGVPLINIEYWTTTANRAVWYVLAVIGGGIIAAAVYIVGSKKEKQTN